MRLYSFDFFRGVAILGVIFHHYMAGPLSQFIYSKTPDHEFIFNPVVNSGWLGVTALFVISGAVLYNAKIIESAKSLFSYYKHRAIRLLPLYFIVILTSFLLNNDDVQTLAKNMFWLLFGLHDLRPSLWIPDMLWVCWSLGVEILFSILLPAVIWMMTRLNFVRTILIFIAFCWIYRLVADHMWFVLNPNYKNPLINPFMDNIVGRIDDFMIGMYAGAMIRKREDFDKKIFISAIFILIISIYGWGLVIESHRNLWISALVSTLHLTMAGSIAVFLVVAARSSIFNKPIASPLVFMGTICYSAYFMHALLMRYFQTFNTEIQWSLHQSMSRVAMTSLTALGVTILVSTITFVYIETMGIKHVPAWAATFRQRVRQGLQAATAWRPPLSWLASGRLRRIRLGSR
ncbi:Peptidoglycan/LPS O-acetylase OafA/YrhL, contains acyltransferase and SGNH-hydrolase domains [Rhodoblastus acidophilus]|uniref:Peptidoglycan/LPS O-acetylase OafA/YrhL, contains acyltransferase and SGNH-hydrolase domains n=1 Tax=Rhodoblastus acidophilus TaxID=1074 RepID=A0A212SAB7_RHOAC|nr:acyltransferase [Rhodoblastus acidophilus]PPQ35925.1 acyltransferase [Rhodoblastus acidophilus]RAI18275.1 acyltransferase [Rhodoblastus acidophilus]SNB82254.1 Peptidoglycan/LPS O-acetylase OafA/YrhL, contains acyltransferase and SGNH-hydrolase domains [Rhodoblastus acidophilus]